MDPSNLPPAADRPVDFTRDIQPIFEAACLRCHGPQRARSGFRLDHRAAALNGGELGVAILPGESARSPLIHYVAGLVPDMEMPPSGKGDPLPAEQIGRLRAWIDQGANWPEFTSAPPQLSAAPTLRWIGVTGDERNFRARTWMTEGWTGGLEHFRLEQSPQPGRVVMLEGHVLGGAEDYKVVLSLEQFEFGFARAGFEQFRRYDDDTGGFYAPFTPPAFHLDRDLQLEVGRAWVELGLTVPDFPRAVLGYEFRYKDGSKATTHWGEVSDGATSKKIYPAWKELDEQVHILKLDVAHELGGVQIEDNFRGEFYDLSVRHHRADFHRTSESRPDFETVTRERQRHFQGVNAFTLEKQLREGWLASGGYLFSRLDGESLFRQQTFPAPGGGPPFPALFSNPILLAQEAHLFNLNSMLGPWEGLTFSAGLQNEWLRQEGLGQTQFEGFPGATVFESNLDKLAWTEVATLRFNRIPFTVLFAETRFHQERLGQFEEAIGGGQDFLRDTRATRDDRDFRAGFNLSPWTPVSLQAQFRRRLRHTAYEHRRDEAFGGANPGYPAFIRARDRDTDEVKLDLKLVPARWLRTSFSWQAVATDYVTRTDAVSGVTSGAPILAGNHDAFIYSFHASLTPHQRFALSTTLSWQASRTRSEASPPPAIAPFAGDVLTILSSGTFALNERTDLHGGYTFVHADFGQDNAADGLPLGSVYDQHGLQLGLTRRLRDNVKTTLQYFFNRFSEPGSGGVNDFTAHGVFATVAMRWP